MWTFRGELTAAHTEVVGYARDDAVVEKPVGHIWDYLGEVKPEEVLTAVAEVLLDLLRLSLWRRRLSFLSCLLPSFLPPPLFGGIGGGRARG